MSLEEIAKFFEQQGIVLSAFQLGQLKRFVELLREWNRKIHLISKGDVENIEERHILPSMVFADFVRAEFGQKAVNIVDLGTGAGLPGVILAVLFPEKRFWLLDSSRKKTLFLKKVKSELSLNFQIVNERFENWQAKNSIKIDLITARAVASIADLLSLTGAVLKEQGTLLITMKSCGLAEPIPDSMKETFRLKVLKNNFASFSDYMKDKCLVSLEYLHGRKETI